MKWLAAVVLLLTCCAGCSTAPPPPPPLEAKPPAAKILQFYASPATIAKGDKALLCYGVEGAASVRLDPAVEEITPSRTRCIEVQPGAASTKYTLYARNKAGEEVSQAVAVVLDPKMESAQVKAGAGTLILFFSSGVQGKAPKGAPVNLCYGVKGASKVTLSPGGQALLPSERMCVQVTPPGTTTYTLTAISAAGAKDTETARVVVAE